MKIKLPLFLRFALLQCLLSVSFSTTLQAAPTGADTVAGNINIIQLDKQITINQTSTKGIINWNSFDVASDETVTFLHPSFESITLNRVTGGSASQIMGNINSTGKIFIINTNGIVFSESSQLNVSGLVASTLDIMDDDFLDDEKYEFNQDSNASLASIINEGKIHVSQRGFAYLIAPHVENKESGEIIVARSGNIGIGAGTHAVIDFSGTGLINFSVSNDDDSQQDSTEPAIDNKGVIRSEGGHVLLSAAAKRSVVTSVINNTGKIEANSLDSLMGGGTSKVEIKAQGGGLSNKGSISANPDTGSMLSGQVVIDVSGSVIQDGQVSATSSADQAKSGSVHITSQDGEIYSSEDAASAMIASDGITLVATSTEGGGVGHASIQTVDGLVQLVLRPLNVSTNSLTVYTQSKDAQDGPSSGNVSINNHTQYERHTLVINTQAHISAQPEDNMAPLALVEYSSLQSAIYGGISAFSASLAAEGLELDTLLHTTKLHHLEATIQGSGQYNHLYVRNQSETLILGEITVNKAWGDAKEASIIQQGDLALSDEIYAAKVIYLNADGGSILNVDSFDLDINGALTSNYVQLVASGAVGREWTEIQVKILGSASSGSSYGLSVGSGSLVREIDGESVTYEGAFIGAQDNLHVELIRTLGTGDVFLSNTQGDITFSGTINSAGQVHINAEAGSILTTGSSGHLIAKGAMTLLAQHEIGKLGATIDAQASYFELRSQEGSVYLDQAQAGDWVLQGSALNDFRVQSIAADGKLSIGALQANAVILGSKGSIGVLAENASLTSDIHANQISLTAKGGIGESDTPLRTNIFRGSKDASLQVKAEGGVYITNVGDVAHDISAALVGGDFVFHSNQDMLLHSLTASHIVLQTTKNINAAQSSSLVSATDLHLSAHGVGEREHALQTLVSNLQVEVLQGGVYIEQSGQSITLQSINSRGDVTISNVDGDMSIYYINAHENDVYLTIHMDKIDGQILPMLIPASEYHIEGDEVIIQSLADVPSDLRIKSRQLKHYVDEKIFNYKSDESILLDAKHLLGHGYENIVVTAPNIYIFDNGGNSLMLDEGTNLTLHALKGNIIFLNTKDSLVFSGETPNRILMTASGSTSLTGMIILGNIEALDHDIEIRASSHVSLGHLNLASGKAYIFSSGGSILDNNGELVNITAGSVTLQATAKSSSVLAAEMTALESYWLSLESQLALQENTLTLTQMQYDAAYRAYIFAKSQNDQFNTERSQAERELHMKQSQERTQEYNYKHLVEQASHASATSLYFHTLSRVFAVIPEIGPVLAGVIDTILESRGVGAQSEIEREGAKLDELKALVESANNAYIQAKIKSDISNNELLVLNTSLTGLDNAVKGAQNFMESMKHDTLAAEQLVAASILADSTQSAIASVEQALGVDAQHISVIVNDPRHSGNGSSYISSHGAITIGDVQLGGTDATFSFESMADVQVQGKIVADKEINISSANGGIAINAGSSLEAQDYIGLHAQGDIALNGSLAVLKSANPSLSDYARQLIELQSTEGAIIGDAAIDLQLIASRIDVSARGDIDLINASTHELSANSGEGSINLSFDGDVLLEQIIAEAGDVSIEASGDISLNSLSAGSGHVSLTSAGDLIALYPHRDKVHLVADSLDISAQGDIGQEDARLFTQTHIINSVVSAHGHIYYSDVDSVVVHGMSAANGNVYLSAQGNISSLNQDSDFSGQNIWLNSSTELDEQSLDHFFDDHLDDHHSVRWNGHLIGGFLIDNESFVKESILFYTEGFMSRVYTIFGDGFHTLKFPLHPKSYEKPRFRKQEKSEDWIYGSL